jgi:thiamine-monophosphate kinase
VGANGVLNVHDWAGECPGDARHSLDLRDDQPPKVVHVVRLGPDDHVVGSGNVVGLGDTDDLPDGEGYLGCLPDLSLDENVSLHHVVLHGRGCHGNATVGARFVCRDSVSQEAVITVADLGEFGLIAAIQELLPSAGSAVVGVGDDAAVLRAPDGRVVASTDLLIEGRHFRREWSAAEDIGAKAAAQSFADIAAMGAVPTALLFGLATPGDRDAAWVLGVTRGMVAECERGRASIVGGDVSAADAVMLAITALGDLAGRDPVTRAGARPGNVIAVSGPVGRSAAGLALLEAGLASRAGPAEAAGLAVPEAGPAEAPELAELVAAHRRPQPDYPAGPLAAAAGATAMIDISDGLVADLGHIAAASGVGLELETASLPGTDVLKATAAVLGIDWLEWALAGGEDHALAATFPDKACPPATWTVVGTVRRGGGVLVDSGRWRGAGGWDHFRKAGW